MASMVATAADVLDLKLDGVGPVANRPFTNYIRKFIKKKKKKKHFTCDS